MKMTEDKTLIKGSSSLLEDLDGVLKVRSMNHLVSESSGVGPCIFICNKLPRRFSYAFKAENN